MPCRVDMSAVMIFHIDIAFTRYFTAYAIDVAYAAVQRAIVSHAATIRTR